MKELRDDYICVQYADDSNIYKHCKTNSIEQNIVKLEKTMKSINGQKAKIYYLTLIKQNL